MFILCENRGLSKENANKYTGMVKRREIERYIISFMSLCRQRLKSLITSLGVRWSVSFARS